MFSDAHVHIKDETFIKKLIELNMEVMINIENQEEYERLKPYLKYKNIHYSCGIHPWSVHKNSLEKMKPLLCESKIIGEIGLDNVWCECDINLQKHVFIQQIIYAYENKKPVILHTKGMEKEILEIIKQYPNTYFVHWYSCLNYIDDYMKLGCYFSIGPDLKDEAVQSVIQKVSMDKLLPESDGLHAICWVKKKDSISFDEYMDTLKETVVYVSEIKRKSADEVKSTFRKNLMNFIGNR